MTMPPGGYPGQPQDPQQPGSGGYGQPTGGGYPPPGGGYPPPGGGYPPPESYPPPGGGPSSGDFPPPGAPGQPGFGPPPAWAPPSQPRRRNRTPLIIAVVAVLAVVLSVVAWAVSRGGNDPKAQAEKFMTAVQNSDFDGAKKLICKDGRDNFANIAELKGQLAGSGNITGFTLGSVTDETFKGDKRKNVEVSIQVGEGTTRTVTLSMTKEGGKYLVCGF